MLYVVYYLNLTSHNYYNTAQKTNMLHLQQKRNFFEEIFDDLYTRIEL